MPKKEKPKGNCRRCGDEFNLWPKNRLYCNTCQVLRDIENGISAKKCEICEDEFWPIRSSHKRCYPCSTWRPENPEKFAACTKCGLHQRPAPGTEKVCCECVSQSETMRDAYIKSLQIKMMKRRKAARKEA